MFEIVLFALVVVAFVFPIAFSFYRKLDNKMLFVFAVFGAQFVIQSLLVAAALPAIVFSIFFLPQLRELGVQFSGYSILSDFVAKYGWLLLPSVLLFALPRVIHRRYYRLFENAEIT